MKKTVLKYGLISGGILGTLTAIITPLCLQSGAKGWVYSQFVGYTAMVLSFLAIFFGIRAYRENEGGGTITFARALGVGVLIALVASALYVIGWQIAYYGFIPDFGDRFAAITLENMRANGATAEELAKATRQMEQFKVWYRNPVMNVLITFVEVFPAGLVVSLISAAILRKRRDGGLPATAAA